jgi:hypothetical protein
MAQKSALESRWTEQEDVLLRIAVASFGEHDNWKTVAQAVPGRTNKACRKVSVRCCSSVSDFLIVFVALASLAFARCKEVCVDAVRGPSTYPTVHSPWSQVVCHRTPNPRKDRRRLLETLPGSTGSQSEEGRLDARRGCSIDAGIRPNRG